MKTVDYIHIQATGGRTSLVDVPLDQFLQELPQLFYLGCVPPIQIIHAFLAKGIDEAGMSGGAVEWTPFSIDQAAYDGLLLALRKRQYRGIRPFDFALIQSSVGTKTEWFARVENHQWGVPYARNLAMMKREQLLKAESREAADSGNEAVAIAKHLAWYECANQLAEFVESYMDGTARTHHDKSVQMNRSDDTSD